MTQFSYPKHKPTTQSEFDVRNQTLSNDLQTAILGGPDLQLKVYPAMLEEAKCLQSVCKKSKGLRELIDLLTWSLE